jgi:CRP-like cAMP-binding protein
MLRNDAKIALLERVPLFERCSKRELREIAARTAELAVPAGRDLTAEGAAGREFVVLVEGAADVRRGGRRIAALGSGDFLGELSLVSGKPRMATVTTTAPSRLLVITADDFGRLMRDVPSIQTKVLAAVADRVPADY